QGLEQGGLAAAVGAEQAQHLATVQAQVDALPQRPAEVADGQAAGLQAAHVARPPRASRIRKQGAPTSAVRMPRGSSMAARVRARVSVSSRKLAPSSRLAGSSREN